MPPDYNVIGSRIRNLRMEKNLTQEELADMIDVSMSFLSRIERGYAHINLKRLTQVSEIFNVTPGYLLTGSNVESKDYLRKEFSEILDRCTPEQQKLIYQISELISKSRLESENNIKSVRR